MQGCSLSKGGENGVEWIAASMRCSVNIRAAEQSAKISERKLSVPAPTGPGGSMSGHKVQVSQAGNW